LFLGLRRGIVRLVKRTGKFAVAPAMKVRQTWFMASSCNDPKVLECAQSNNANDL
jgi:hypothetical protein